MPPPRIRSILLLERLRALRQFLRKSPFQTPAFAHAQSALPWYTRAFIKYALFFAGYHLFTSNLYSIRTTHGPSMYPTIPMNGRGFQLPLLLISHLYKRGADIKVGDLVTFKSPMHPSIDGLKRVIGMPGDLVCVQTPCPSHEDGDDDGSNFKEEMIRVPEGHCWVVGDNLDFSRDSRMWGPLPLNLVTGKALGMVMAPDKREWFG